MSNLVVDTLTNQDVQLCKAWVNFNGTGTVAIRASYNVSSITDNGVGNYTVNFTVAMSDANYSVGGVCSSTSGNIGVFSTLVSDSDFAKSTISCAVATYSSVGYSDKTSINVTIQGN